MSDWHPDIFDFMDYREFLRAWYEAGKEHTRVVSYRYLARRAGFSSPSYLRHVMNGERNLGAASVEQLIEALELAHAEAAHFRALVAFNQAATAEEQNRAFELINASRRFHGARRIEGALFEYLSHWYYPAIREMAARPDFKNDPAWVAKQLLPPIPTAQARAALALLFELGLLNRADDGTITRGDPSIATQHEVRNLAIGNYHRQMLERAAGSIESVASHHRDLAAMTICISRETIPELKRRIHEFREVVLDICDRDPAPSIVYQFNTQIFPLTDPES